MSIVSFVRTYYPGYLNNLSEANVAVTRGTRLRVIVGDTTLMSEAQLWGSILNCSTANLMEVSMRYMPEESLTCQWNESSNPRLQLSTSLPPSSHNLINP